MKEYTMKNTVIFEYVLHNLEFLQTYDTTKVKINADLLNLALSPLKWLKIQNKYTLNKYK